MVALVRRRAAIGWAVLGILILSLIGVLVYKTWPVLFPQLVAVAAPDPDCDLRAGPCSGVLPGGGRIGFRIEPDDIPVLQPLMLSVRLDGLDVQGVEVDFAGTDMNMGYNRVPLQRDVTGLWQGQGILPVCVRNVMHWEATVLLKTPDGLMAAPFRFDTYRN